MLDPQGYLKNVHPDLVKVVEAASQSPQPFEIIYGIRTEQAEQHALATGHSQTMHSRHLPQSEENMKSCAVDVVALTNGQVDWARGHEESIFGQIAEQVLAAAHELNIPLQWGGQAIGAWVPGAESHFRDWGHFQLPWKEYP